MGEQRDVEDEVGNLAGSARPRTAAAVPARRCRPGRSPRRRSSPGTPAGGTFGRAAERRRTAGSCPRPGPAEATVRFPSGRCRTVYVTPGLRRPRTAGPVQFRAMGTTIACVAPAAGARSERRTRAPASLRRPASRAFRSPRYLAAADAPRPDRPLSRRRVHGRRPALSRPRGRPSAVAWAAGKPARGHRRNPSARRRPRRAVPPAEAPPPARTVGPPARGPGRTRPRPIRPGGRGPA